MESSRRWSKCSPHGSRGSWSDAWNLDARAVAWSGCPRSDRVAFIYSVLAESFDPFQYGVIIGQGVRVRQEPRASSPSLTTLSFDVVGVTDWAPTSDADAARSKQSAAMSSGSRRGVA